MKRALVGVLCTAFLVSIVPLVGCGGGGDTGVPADTTQGVPLSNVKTEMKNLPTMLKEQHSKKETEKTEK
jgi:hypothetical protein